LTDGIGGGELDHDGVERDGVVVMVVGVGSSECLKGRPKLITKLFADGSFHVDHHHQDVGCVMLKWSVFKDVVTKIVEVGCCARDGLSTGHSIVEDGKERI